MSKSNPQDSFGAALDALGESLGTIQDVIANADKQEQMASVGFQLLEEAIALLDRVVAKNAELTANNLVLQDRIVRLERQLYERGYQDS